MTLVGTHQLPQIINDFISDFPPAREADGKKINDFIDDFINDFPPAGEAGGKIIHDLSPARKPAERGDSGGGGGGPPGQPEFVNEFIMIWSRGRLGEGGRRKIINDFLNEFPPAGRPAENN